jgi:hypothetical protein
MPANEIINGWEFLVERLEGREIDKEILLAPKKGKAKPKPIEVPPSKQELHDMIKAKKPLPVLPASAFNLKVLPEGTYNLLFNMMNGSLLTSTPLSVAIPLATASGSGKHFYLADENFQDFFMEVIKCYGKGDINQNSDPSNIWLLFQDQGHHIVYPYTTNYPLNLWKMMYKFDKEWQFKGSIYWSSQFALMLYEQRELEDKYEIITKPFPNLITLFNPIKYFEWFSAVLPIDDEAA